MIRMFLLSTNGLGSYNFRKPLTKGTLCAGELLSEACLAVL